MTTTVRESSTLSRSPAAINEQSPAARLASIDALRGFDMFWIIGAGALVRAVENLSGHPATRFLSTQLQHVTWTGFRFYDLIFPLFLFIVGVSMVFSLDRATAQGGRGLAMWRVLRRSFNETSLVEESKWIEIVRQTFMLLAIRPPARTSAGNVEVRITQRSSGRTAAVEFDLDPGAAGPGCFVVG